MPETQRYTVHLPNSPDCVECDKAVFEDWPKGEEVVRCFNPDAGKWAKRCTGQHKKGNWWHVYAPAWCPKREEWKGVEW